MKRISQKVEDVARGLALANGVNPDRMTAEHLGDEPQMIWKTFVSQARAAICALRKPTINMVAAGQHVVWKSGATSGPQTVQVVTDTFSKIFEAMIDEALT